MLSGYAPVQLYILWGFKAEVKHTVMNYGFMTIYCPDSQQSFIGKQALFKVDLLGVYRSFHSVLSLCLSNALPACSIKSH